MTLTINNHIIFPFSDTHGHHRALRVPEGADIIISAGDAVEDNLKGGEYEDFINWFSSLPAKWKLYVPGNHELSFELGKADTIVKEMTAHGILVLQNAVTDCDGLTIGSIDRNILIEDQDIPTDLDILVTHYPPYGILDEDLGCPQILNFMMKSQPAYHLFGHIHGTEGQFFQFGKTKCVNVSCFQKCNFH